MESQRSGLPKQVQQIFERDGVVNEAVARGIVNYRALARWIMEGTGVVASEDAVLSAIRRIRGSQSVRPFRAAHKVVAESHLNVRSSLCQLTAPRTKGIQERLAAIFREIDFERGEILYYTQGESGIKILVDESNLRTVQAHLGTHILQVTKHLAAVSIVQPREGLQTPGILALLTNALALQNINVVDAVFGLPEYLFFVKQEDTLRAYQALEALISVSRQEAQNEKVPRAHGRPFRRRPVARA
ncbi:MAG: hypothetical protein HYT80_06455 [Euryarchaeota archaeon]|nr:hypothetical protein [Euryarchaeota archaeon]